MLTKKDFKAVAENIATTIGDGFDDSDYDLGWQDAIEDIAKQLADYFAAQNPRFDRERFMQVCGLGD